MFIIVIMEQENNKEGKRLIFKPKIPKRNGDSVKYINPVKSKKQKLCKDVQGDDSTNINHVEISKPVIEEDKWIKWSDRIVKFDFLVMSKQIRWLKDNIFVDDKNFFFYTKRHNEKMSLMVIREAIRMSMSEHMSKFNYYNKQYNPNIENNLATPLIKYFKINEDSLKEKNEEYKRLAIEYKQKFNSVNRKMGIVRNRILKLDASMKKVLHSVTNEEKLFDYFYLKGYKTITVNY